MKKPFDPTDSDTTSKFIFDESDIRGETVHLQKTYSDVMAAQLYPDAIARLLGEFLAAVTLLSTTIKFEGTLSLQATSDEGVSLIMAQCSSEQEIRAIVRGFEDLGGDSFTAMLGGGLLAITIEPKEGTRYQGLVSLEGETLAEALEAYFEQSEQLPTKLWLASNGKQCAGLLLQQLPSQLTVEPTERIEQW
ncbi:MAG: molecular chaperone Hsp33, partial [Halieaceae bacterium]